MSAPPLVIILGPTASGKTKVAAKVAHRVDGEIISADSRQVYKYLDLGTGKDLDEFKQGNQHIAYHLIDICEPSEEYNVLRFQQDFARAFSGIVSRKKLAILCGGTGLYIQSILDKHQLTGIPRDDKLRHDLSGLTIQQLQNMLDKQRFPHGLLPDTSTRKRLIRAIEISIYLQTHDPETVSIPDFSAMVFGISADRLHRRQLITTRLEKRLQTGLIEEVEALIAKGLSKEKLRRFGLEYKYITDHLDGHYDRDELFTKLNTAIHQFAKRQMTWFRKMEREGYNIRWIDAQLPVEKQVQIIVDNYCG